MAYLMFVMVLCQQTEFYQLLNVPGLIVHYFEHSQTNSQLTFVEYLHEHYCEEHHHCDQEDGKAHELPFQNCDSNHCYTLCVLSYPQDFSISGIDSHLQHSIARSEYFYSESLNDIWQPPKL